MCVQPTWKFKVLTPSLKFAYGTRNLTRSRCTDSEPREQHEFLRGRAPPGRCGVCSILCAVGRPAGGRRLKAWGGLRLGARRGTQWLDRGGLRFKSTVPLVLRPFLRCQFGVPRPGPAWRQRHPKKNLIMMANMTKFVPKLKHGTCLVVWQVPPGRRRGRKSLTNHWHDFCHYGSLVLY